MNIEVNENIAEILLNLYRVIEFDVGVVVRLIVAGNFG